MTGSTAAILDQLLEQGAVKIERVFDMNGTPAPCCVLTPGGPRQPPFAGAKARQAAAAAEAAQSDASESAFFDSLVAGGSRGQDYDEAAPMMLPGMKGLGGMGGGTGSDIMAMLQQGGMGGVSPMGGMGAMGSGQNASPMLAPPRHLMPRTTRGSTGGGQRINDGGGGGGDEGFFDASSGGRSRSPSSMLNSDGTRGGGIGGGGLFGPASIGGIPSPFGEPPSSSSITSGSISSLFGSGGGVGNGLGPPPNMGPPMPGADLMMSLGLSGTTGAGREGDGDGADIMAMLNKPSGDPSPVAALATGGAPSGVNLLAMLGGSSSGMPPMPPMPGTKGVMLSAADLEAQTMRGVEAPSSESPEGVDLMGMLGAAASKSSGSGGGMDIMGLLAGPNAGAMPPMPADGRRADDLHNESLGEGMLNGLGMTGSSVGLDFLGFEEVEAPQEVGEKKNLEEAKKDTRKEREEKKKQREKEKKAKKAAEKPADKGEWQWSIGMEHREKEREEADADAERKTAAMVAAAVKGGSDRLEKPVGKKSAFEATSHLQEPLPEDNIGRQLLKKQGWQPLVDPTTGDVVDEAPVPIPDQGLPERAGLGSVEWFPPTVSKAEQTQVHAQARVLEMVGEAKGTLSRPSSIGKLRASASNTATAGSGRSSNLGLSDGGDGNEENDDEWAKDVEDEAKGTGKGREVIDAKRTNEGDAGEEAGGTVDDWEDIASPSPLKLAVKPKNTYSTAELKKLNVGCDATPPGMDKDMFDAADKEKVIAAREKEKAEKEMEKAEKEAAKAAKKAAKKAENVKAVEEKAAAAAPKVGDTAKSNIMSNSRSSDQLDGPSLGGALGLGFLGITPVDETEVKTTPVPNPAAVSEKSNKSDPSTSGGGMSVSDLAAALMAELRGLEDRVEVIGSEEGPMVALKLGAALEAIRQEPFKSI